MSEEETTIERESEADDILQTIAREYDGIQDPETPAHQVWETVNWLKDSLGDEFGDIVSELKSVDDVAITVIEHSDTQAVEIHHTFAEPLPPEITGPVSSTPSKIRGHESKFDAEDNMVETAIWVVPNAASNDWESPEFRRLSDQSGRVVQTNEKAHESERPSKGPLLTDRTREIFTLSNGIKVWLQGVAAAALLHFVRGQLIGNIQPENEIVFSVGLVGAYAVIAGGSIIGIGSTVLEWAGDAR